eukprot:361296-Pelagomonas_calceolata.AAC.10
MHTYRPQESMHETQSPSSQSNTGFVACCALYACMPTGLRKQNPSKASQEARSTCISPCTLHGCRPQKVESCATASGTYAAAAGYVVACEEGVVRDVTTRYLTNTLAVKRLRDGPWWAATQQKLEQLAGEEVMVAGAIYELASKCV